jgi:hypothetical protein
MGGLFFPVAMAVTEEGGYRYLQPGGVAFNLTLFLIGTAIGGLLACILTVLHHARMGRLVHALIENRASSPETARSLEELGVSPILGLGLALRSGTSLLRKLVAISLPDGTVLSPIHSMDDDRAAAEAAASYIHAEEASETAPPRPEAPAGTRVDLRTARFYMDDLHRRRAEIRFARHGNEAILLIPAIVLFIGLAVALPLYMPDLMNVLDGILVAILGD